MFSLGSVTSDCHWFSSTFLWPAHLNFLWEFILLNPLFKCRFSRALLTLQSTPSPHIIPIASIVFYIITSQIMSSIQTSLLSLTLSIPLLNWSLHWISHRYLHINMPKLNLWFSLPNLLLIKYILCNWALYPLSYQETIGQLEIGSILSEKIIFPTDKMYISDDDKRQHSYEVWSTFFETLSNTDRESERTQNTHTHTHTNKQSTSKFQISV